MCEFHSQPTYLWKCCSWVWGGLWVCYGEEWITGWLILWRGFRFARKTNFKKVNINVCCILYFNSDKVTRDTDFSGTVPNNHSLSWIFSKAIWDTDLSVIRLRCGGLSQFKRIFLDRAFLKVEKWRWSYSVNLSSPLLATLLFTMLTSYGSITLFFLEWLCAVIGFWGYPDCMLVGYRRLLFICDFYK